ncbi:MAG TPA: CBS domain-containing protein [Acidiphilium sp.]|nr:MAG: histidine kinase [Acidiphilium sp. 21-60-14]OYV89603.1 MAG: histidine kinase [Acidiphilium sp. 37-60-79]OZB39359.1 MAG: histidine kinase [Acidiphilium sp. 34-60-192]HQT88755.1 CBS domain-containing protein [Acidiphilium sp.]HQU24610.1 CBS domain-containing protein [Acidiphilium sp.]
MTTIRQVLDQKGWGSIVISGNRPLQRAAKFLADNRIGAAPVVDDNGKLVGMLSERDIMRFVGEFGTDISRRTAADLMTTIVASCAPNNTILDAMLLMTNRRCRHLPVFEDHALVGIVSIGDLVKARLEEAEFEVDSLRAYIAS